jgi:hypothetical protein
MATEIPGSQLIVQDNKIIERKVVIEAGGPPSAPGGNGVFTASEITTLPGGLQRGTFEYTRFGKTGAGEQPGTSGPQIELMGGSREVPIQTHPKFADLSEEDVAAITAAAEQNDDSLLPESMEGGAETLYRMLRRKVTHYLAPSVVARVTDIESGVPSLAGLTTLEGPAGVDGAPGSKWLLTGVSARGFGTEFEVSREYTLIGDGAEFANFLYS